MSVKNKPSVFIVTPCFNSEKTIEQTIMSVFLQPSDINIFYHIQDGGSTDSTLKILKKWKHLIKSSRPHISFSYDSEHDSGMYDAIARGFDRFDINDNDWMCWINSDDQLSGLFSPTISAVALNHPEIQWMTGKTAVFDKSKKLHIHERYYTNEHIINGLCNGKHWFFIQQEGTCWKSNLWNKSDARDILDSYKLAGDFALWVNFAKHTQIYKVQHPLGFFNMREGQLSASQFDNYILETTKSTTLSEEEKVVKASSIKNFESYNLYLNDFKIKLKVEKITVGNNKMVTIVDDYVK